MKKVISILLVIVLIFLFSTEKKSAYADALTISQIAGAAYAYGQSAGINWAFTNGTAEGAKTWLENEINSWLGGQSIAEVFGSDVITTTVGKLLIPSTIALRIADFLRSLVTKFNIDTDTELSTGEVDGVQVGVGGNDYIRNYNELTWVGVEVWCDIEINKQYTDNRTVPIRCYLNGVQKYVNSISGTAVKALGWELSINGSGEVVWTNYYTTGLTNPVMRKNTANLGVLQLDNQISASLGENYGYPEYPDVGYQWEGTFDGVSPDTNLDQLIGTIFDEVADNNLVVDGDVVDPGPAPTPVPTPYPVDPDTPLNDVPWEGLNDLIGQTGAGINEQIQSQTQSITSAQEATTEAVEALTDTIADALDVPDSQEIPDFKFDLREFFPFCIPFDIYRLLTSFDAEPVAPHVQIPFVIQSLNFSYNIDLDFSVFDPVAQVLRTVEFIVYALGLAWATGKVIKW